MLSIVSPDGRAQVAIDERCGARLASLRLDGVELFVTSAPDALQWGCYPMVPYAGRVRDGVVTFGGSTHLPPAIAPPHALHGTVFATPWTVLDHSDTRAVLLAELDVPWPIEGTVRHVVDIDDDGVTLRLEVTAHDDMPCQVGWHPWFVRPETYTVPFRTMWPRDTAGITLRTPTPHDPHNDRHGAHLGTYDDCFSDPITPPTLTYRTAPDETLTIRLDSDCSHWVVYDQPEHAVCLEPQSGPPNQINDDPVVLASGETLTRKFRIGWGNTRR